jgi:hypothetical protein
MSEMGQSRHFRDVRGTSALHPIFAVTADIPDGQLGAGAHFSPWDPRRKNISDCEVRHKPVRCLSVKCPATSHLDSKATPEYGRRTWQAIR